MTTFKERWPDLADSAEVAGFTFYLYKDNGIIEWPMPDYGDETHDAMVTVADLREIARVATWAAARLEGRSS